MKGSALPPPPLLLLEIHDFVASRPQYMLRHTDASPPRNDFLQLVEHSDGFEWRPSIRGPPGSGYDTNLAGYRLNIVWAPDHPHSSPSVRFASIIFNRAVTPQNSAGLEEGFLSSEFYDELDRLAALAPGPAAAYSVRDCMDTVYQLLVPPGTPSCTSGADDDGSAAEEFRAMASHNRDRETLITSYAKLAVHPELFALSSSPYSGDLPSGWLDPAFAAALKRLGQPTPPTPCAAGSAGVGGVGAGGGGGGFTNEQLDEAFSGLVSVEAPFVYSFPILSAEMCAKLHEEVVAGYMASSGLPDLRPNSMNKTGCVVNHIGLEGLIDVLSAFYLRPLAAFLYGKLGAQLDGHHSFCVTYSAAAPGGGGGGDGAAAGFAAAGDRSLDMHVDSSDVTLNIALGGEHSGSALRFCGIRGAAASSDLWEHRHQVTLAHKPGTAIIHLGRHRHGADEITSGDRCNLICWLKNSWTRTYADHAAMALRHEQEQQEAGEGAHVDRVCLSNVELNHVELNH